MPVRDIVLLVVIIGSLPVCFVRPWIGLLVWSWLAFMNPHLHTWAFAASSPFSQWVGLATLGGAVFSRDRQPFVWSREVAVLVLLLGWFTVTTMYALYPAEAWPQWERVSKILLMTFLVIPFFQDRRRLRILLLVVAASIGFYGLKGGIWVLLTGGNYQVLGAPGASFISTNNALALALNMCLPILFYLAKEERRPWLRLALYLTFLASIISVLFTYSRGGLVGLLIVLSVLFLHWRNIPHVAVAAILVAVLAFGFAPQKWLDRMDTIIHYQQEASANLRLLSWQVSFMLANDHPITGGGFWGISNLATFARYMPDYPAGSHDAHSIYFNLLGEHGYPGLAIFAVFVGLTLMTLETIRKRALQEPELQWAANYAFMLRASIVAYLTSGAFLSVAYFDLAYLLFIVVGLVKVLMEREIEARVAKKPASAGASRTPAQPRRRPLVSLAPRLGRTS